MVEAISKEGVLDLALPLLLTGIEALTNTGRRDVRRQLAQRLPRIADEVGVAGVTTELCNELYDARSQATHGGSIRLFSGRPGETDSVSSGPPAEAVAKVATLQSLLRAIVRAAIEDPAFAAAFESAETVRRRWPVVIEL